MLKSKKLTIGIMACALMALCLTLFGLASTNTSKVVLADTDTPSIDVRVEYYKDGIGNGTYDTLYSKENVLSANVQSVGSEISTKMWSAWHKPLIDMKVIIDLNGDFTGAMEYFSGFCGELVLNLNSHTLTLNNDNYWLVFGNVTINGGGKITMPEPVNQDKFTYGVIAVSGSLNVNNVTFEDCNTNSSYPVLFVGRDAAIYDNAKVTLNNCTFNNCSSNGNGGAIACDTGVKGMTVTGCTFDTCSAKNGGAIYYYDYSNDYRKEVKFNSHCKFINCTATEFGGAIHMKVNNCTFQTYDALFENCYAKNGGAISVITTAPDDISFIIYNPGSKITGCSATENGGGIYAKGSWLEFNSGEICYCEAKCGAGLYVENGENGGALHSVNNMKIHDCTASILGGGYYAPPGSSISIGSGQYYDNTPASSGNSYASMISGGSVIIICVVAGVAIITAGVFMTLYFKNRKKTGTEG